MRLYTNRKISNKTTDKTLFSTELVGFWSYEPDQHPELNRTIGSHGRDTLGYMRFMKFYINLARQIPARVYEASAGRVWSLPGRVW